ncbi:molybdate ABC transporter substrate-binding protein [Methylomonas sp. AM2-LC]|uniref:molybdate ABC transporter substrate-binding protein n=1 Tax=Methylomonas sp. AM2-LC TaxID=3153301 RepID=UPI003265A257
MFKLTVIRAVYILCLALCNNLVNADTTLVAVAANFSKPMTEIADSFEKATGHSAKLSFGSSGKFVAQIENGAPFEVFLSADESGPAKVEQDGLAVSGSRNTYAIGKLVLWSSTPGYVDSEGKILATGGFKHVSVADPKLAPYGAAAIDYLKKQGLLEKLQPLMVFGENITQTQLFVSSGNAELGFVALSQVYEDGHINSGSGYIIPTSQYAPIKQGAVLLTKGNDNPAAKALIDYLKSDTARSIISKYGYDLP